MRGKNPATSSYLHKCLNLIRYALSWASSNSQHNPNSTPEYLFVWQEYGFKKIATADITHLAAARSYCEIHLSGVPKMVVSVPMSEVGKHLCHRDFIPIHRSFIINLRHVVALVGNMVIMESGQKLPISKEYRSILLGYFCFVGSKSKKFML